MTSEPNTSNPTQGGGHVVACGSTPPSKAKERQKFECWMRKYWGGIRLDVETIGREAFEFKETAAQTAWEVWAKFNGVKP